MKPKTAVWKSAAMMVTKPWKRYTWPRGRMDQLDKVRGPQIAWEVDTCSTKVDIAWLESKWHRWADTGCLSYHRNMLLFLENNKDHNKYLTVNMDIHVRIMVQKIKFCLEMEIRYTPIC